MGLWPAEEEAERGVRQSRCQAETNPSSPDRDYSGMGRRPREDNRAAGSPQQRPRSSGFEAPKKAGFSS
jgi:hypothetical protein